MLVGWIRATGGCVRVGETVYISLKGGGAQNRGGETKILKRGGKLSQGVGAFKRGGLEPPYKLWLNAVFLSCK